MTCAESASAPTPPVSEYLEALVGELEALKALVDMEKVEWGKHPEHRTADRINPIQDRLRRIDSQRDNGTFRGTCEDAGTIPRGQGYL
eukprot:gene6888-6561_t